MTDGCWTRRGTVVALAALAGCGGGRRSTSVTDAATTTTDAEETASPTAEPASTQSSASTETATPSTSTRTPATTDEPAPTPRQARSPPPHTLALRGRQINVLEIDNHYRIDLAIALRNRPDVPDRVSFRYVEFRVDVYHETPIAGRSHVVGGYVDDRFLPELPRGTFDPGENRDITGSLRYPVVGSPTDSTDETEFSVELAFREVVYE